MLFIKRSIDHIMLCGPKLHANCIAERQLPGIQEEMQAIQRGQAQGSSFTRSHLCHFYSDTKRVWMCGTMPAPLRAEARHGDEWRHCGRASAPEL